MGDKRDIVWFEEVDKNDVGLVGGKGANLGELSRSDFPIPYGFIITSHAYFAFIEKAGLAKKIGDFLAMVNFDNPKELQEASHNIRDLFYRSELSQELTRKIILFYHDLLAKEKKYLNRRATLLSIGVQQLTTVFKEPYVAVRSSATAEDLPNASFAGQQETFLNIRGEAQLLQKIRECWASLFTERAIFYRHQQGFDSFKVGIAAIVQRMVQSEEAGVAFSVDPTTNDASKIVIEAIYGLGEYIVQGRITPDHYLVDKHTFTILGKQVVPQKIKYVKSKGENKSVSVSSQERSRQKLTDEEILKVAFLTKDIESHYYYPQDIEWAIEGDRVFVVQSRPITTIQKLEQRTSNKEQKEEEFLTHKSKFLILTGSPASPGIGTGPVQIIHSAREIEQIKKGDILVAPQTNPDYVPAMKKASGIVTEKGGRTSHAAIVSRELGIPAVVGAENAIKLLRNSVIITVDGATGEIFRGGRSEEAKTQESRVKGEEKHKRLKTLTKVYVNLAEPERAAETAKQDVDGVGLLRAEFMMAEIGIHPKEFIRRKKSEVFVRKLAHELLRFVKPFHPRPVIYRASDLKTNEYKNLVGGKTYEASEENPMLGFRGAFRYVTDPQVFKLELEALKLIWNMDYSNLHLMIPFVRRPWELVKIKGILDQYEFTKKEDFKLYMMVEVPAAALELEEFLKVGVDGVSVGTNDLTMLLLGVDRDNEHVAHLYDERSSVVLSVLEHIAKICNKYGVTSSVCGQAVSDYPDFVEKLIGFGISSVSVNPDAIERTREQIYQIEHERFRRRKIKNEKLTA